MILSKPLGTRHTQTLPLDSEEEKKKEIASALQKTYINTAVPSSGPPAAPRSEASSTQPQAINLRYLVKALTKYNASDLHIKPGRPPLFRIDGKLVPAKMDPLSEELVRSICREIIPERLMIELEQKKHIDFSFPVDKYGRFRCNAFFQRGSIALAIRTIPMTVPKIEELGLPPVLRELCHRPRGLVLVTGPTGSGKSTTLAALIQYINENRYVHVLDLEDPIEFMFQEQKALITQRELGSDLLSYHDGLIAGLRQDPDVIVLGEIRDRDMIQNVITASETGHLVFSTIHTGDAKGTIDRVLDVFPGDMQDQIRVQLAANLVGVVSQKLIPRADGKGRVAACEVMVKSPHIEELILRNEIGKIPDAIAGSNGYYKMQTFNQCLQRLVEGGIITIEEARKHSPNPDNLEMKVAGITRNELYSAS